MQTSRTVPIAVYWAYSGVHTALGNSRLMDKYRLNTKDEEDRKNMVSKRAVILNVLMQLAALALLTMVPTTAAKADGVSRTAAYLTAAARIAAAVLVFDAYRYAWHRLAHLNRFLYRHLHPWHHRIVVPYAFGAIYGHPVEVLIADTAGASLAVLVTGLLPSSPRATAMFLTLCTVKAIDNHCGVCLLPRRLQSVWNGAAYHGVHHLPRGVRYNFSDLFFVTWDHVFGTHMPYAVEERPGGDGLVLKPLPPPKNN
ncbi:sphinganine C4-monooxygenase 2-like [Hordeum vulgare subsp. vulgare]|uniref:sphinganine C4-monooxygenase 2-like n=1 Tax=Hordeum vulgare subsp. vulgare TaxID=112509 RepID=UPI001D1A5A4C|nr:sphinganine C4-monooxygenase 2-like [Hordeum vulgare subsp. vulgare]